MSTITKTNNYGLIVYDNATSLIAIDVSKNFTILDSEIHKVNVEGEALEARVDATEHDIMDNRSSIADNSKKISDLESDYNELDIRVTNNESDIKLLQPETIKEVVERLELAEQNVSNNASAIEGITIRLTDDEDNLSEHARRLDSLDQKTNTINTSVGELGAEIVEIKTNITTLQNEVVTWQADVASLDDKLNENLSETQGLQDLVKAISSQIATINNQISNLQSRMTTTESKIINLDERVTALENK